MKSSGALATPRRVAAAPPPRRTARRACSRPTHPLRPASPHLHRPAVTGPGRVTGPLAFPPPVPRRRPDAGAPRAAHSLGSWTRGSSSISTASSRYTRRSPRPIAPVSSPPETSPRSAIAPARLRAPDTPPSRHTTARPRAPPPRVTPPRDTRHSAAADLPCRRCWSTHGPRRASSRCDRGRRSQPTCVGSCSASRCSPSHPSRHSLGSSARETAAVLPRAARWPTRYACVCICLPGMHRLVCVCTCCQAVDTHAVHVSYTLAQATRGIEAAALYSRGCSRGCSLVHEPTRPPGCGSSRTGSTAPGWLGTRACSPPWWRRLTSSRRSWRAQRAATRSRHSATRACVAAAAVPR